MKSQCAKALAILRPTALCRLTCWRGDPVGFYLNYLSHGYDSVRGRTDKHVTEVNAQIRASRPRSARGRVARWWALLWS